MELKLTRLKVKILSDDLPAYKIAAECGIHPTTMSQLAQGQIGFNQKNLSKLCGYFGCEADEITGWVTFELED